MNATNDSRPRSSKRWWLLLLAAAVLACFVALLHDDRLRQALGINRPPVLEYAVVPPRGDAPEGIEVYHAKPFRSPPLLEFPQGLNDCIVVEQTGKRFTLKNTANYQRIVVWHARGVR